MTTETALPVSAEPAVEVSANPVEQLQTGSASVEGSEESKTEDPPKVEKTPEQREIDRMRRGLDRRTRQLAEARAQLSLTRSPVEINNNSASDSETLSLSRAELAQLVKAEAAKLAPAVQAERAEIEQRRGVVESLAKSWGQEKFDTVAADLNEAFGGGEGTNALLDSHGKPRPATDAIFTADNPQAIIEYLIDPDNADEAERIADMGALQAGRAIERLEVKLKTAKAKEKPQASKAQKPLEALPGGGAPKGMPDPSNTKAWIAWRNAQERRAGY